MSDLYQDEHWTTRDGREITLGEMTPSHRANLLAYLERHAAGLKHRADLSLILIPTPQASGGADVFDAALERAFEQDPDMWLAELPLVVRLRELVEADRKEEAQ